MARIGIAREDRGHLAGFLGRSGRRLCRDAGIAGAGRGQRAARARRSTSFRGRPPRQFRGQCARAGRSRQVVLDEDRQRMEVVVPDQQLSLAIGRRGRTCGWPRSSPAGTSTSSPSREVRAPPGEFEAHQAVHRGAQCRRGGRPAARLGRQPRSRARHGRREEIAGIEASTRIPRTSCRRAPASSSRRRAELDAKRKELGVEDALKEVPGVTAMLVKLGENDIKTIEDLAGCATDDLFGWSERKEGETSVPRLPRWLRADARRDRGADHAGPRQAGWIRRRISSTACRRGPGRGGDAAPRKDEDDARSNARRYTTPGRARTRTEAAVLRRDRRVKRSRMIRFVLGPDSAAVPDLKRRLPGAASDHGDAKCARDRDRPQGVCPQLQAGCAAARDLVAITERLLEQAALDALAIAHKPAGSRSQLPRPRRRSPATGWPASSMRRKRRRTAPESSLLRCTAARTPPRFPRSGPLPRCNWIWHWGGQM